MPGAKVNSLRGTNWLELILTLILLIYTIFTFRNQIVLDVHGFSAEDISIRATSHNELVVEGKVDQKEPSGAVSCHKFSKFFILPAPVRMNEITAALSEDDILTISVPKNSVLQIMHRL